MVKSVYLQLIAMVKVWAASTIPMIMYQKWVLWHLYSFSRLSQKCYLLTKKFE